jgi:hypothetical protein
VFPFGYVPQPPAPIEPPVKPPLGQAVPYACIAGRNLGYTFCGSQFRVGLDFVFSLASAEYTAERYDTRKMKRHAAGQLVACIKCCDAIDAEKKRAELA